MRISHAKVWRKFLFQKVVLEFKKVIDFASNRCSSSKIWSSARVFYILCYLAYVFCSEYAAWTAQKCMPSQERHWGNVIWPDSGLYCYEQYYMFLTGPFRNVMLSPIQHCCWTHNTSAAMATATRSTSCKLYKGPEAGCYCWWKVGAVISSGE